MPVRAHEAHHSDAAHFEIVEDEVVPENLEKRNGVWQFRAVIAGKLYRRTTGFTDLQRARRKAGDIEKAIRDGNAGWIKPKVPTFAAWAEQYLNKHYTSASGFLGLDDKWPYGTPGYVNHLMLRRAAAKFGQLPLDKILPSDMVEYFNALKADGYKGGSLERERIALKGLYRAAIANKLVTDNPMDVIKAFRSVARTRTLSREDEVLLRAHMKPVWERYMTVALGTGLRAKEMRSARPMDLRHNGTWLWVRPESNKLRKGREVPLAPGVITALKEQQASREGDATVPYWPIKDITAYNYFSNLCDTLKIGKITPHDFRRTFATRCVEKKMNPKHIMLIMGHTSVNLTMDIYAVVEAGSVRDALMEMGE